MVNQYKKRFAMTMLYMTLSYFQQYSLGLLKEIIYLEEMQSIIYLTISHSLAFLN